MKQLIKILLLQLLLKAGEWRKTKGINITLAEGSIHYINISAIKLYHCSLLQICTAASVLSKLLLNLSVFLLLHPSVMRNGTI